MFTSSSSSSSLDRDLDLDLDPDLDLDLDFDFPSYSHSPDETKCNVQLSQSYIYAIKGCTDQLSCTCLTFVVEPLSLHSFQFTNTFIGHPI